MLNNEQPIDPKYVRVTTILYPFSGLSSLPKFILNVAAERGTIVHNICSAKIEGIGYPPYHEKYQGYIDSFDQWSKDKKFIENLSRLYCDEHLITGEVDNIYEDEKGLVLVDWKTSKKEGNTWKYQGSAYSYLCKKAGYDIKRIEFVKLSHDGSYPIVYTYDERFDIFLKKLETYREDFRDMDINNLLASYE